MITYLGTAGKINENDINISAVKESEILFLEGYLWDEGDPKKAFDKAINYSNKVAMSLSDLFCVERHKPHFLNLVEKKLDITFANEQEIFSLIEAKKIEDVKCPAQKNLDIVDLTGAGDLFASGFLDCFIKRKSLEASLEKGTKMASEIIQVIGARLKK